MQTDDVVRAEGDSSAGSEPALVQEAKSTQKLRLTKPHRLIQRMLEKETPKPADYGYYRHAPSKPEVDIQVSKAERRNALIVMDRLFKALEARDFKIEVTEGGGYRHGSYGNDAAGTYATSSDGRDRTRVSISEEHKKVPHVPTAKELKEKELHKYGPAIPKYDNVPTSKLTLSPGGVVDLSSETAVGRVVQKAVIEVEAKLLKRRLEREADEETQRREQRRQKDEATEKARVEALHKASASMRNYQNLMDYIAEVRRFGRVPSDQRREGQTLEEWLRWAEWQARLIHPIG